MRRLGATTASRLATALCLMALAAFARPEIALAMSDRNASQAYLAEAKDDIRQGKIDDAITELKRALRSDPNNIDARLQLAGLYIRVGNGISAEKEVRAAINRGKLEGSAQDKLADAYLLQGKYEELLSEITAKSAGSAALPEVLRARAEAYYALNRLANAVAAYKAAEALRPDSPRPMAGLARVYIRQGDLASAEKEADAALAADAHSFDALLAKGNVLQAKGNLNGAIAQFDAALSVRPDDIEGLMARAIALVDLKKYDAALADVTTVRNREPRQPMATYLNALIKARTGDFDAAEDILLRADTVLHNFQPAIFLSGAVAYAQGSYEQATVDLKRYLADHPKNIPATRLLGASLLRTGDPDTAASLLEPIAAKMPGDDRIHAILGSAYMAKKEYERAVQQFEQAVAAAPGDGPLRTRLLVSRLAIGDDEGAFHALAPALSSGPEAIRAATLLAQNELKARRYGKVLEVGKALSAVYPSNPLGQAIIAAAYWGRNDFAAARHHYAEALKIDPHYRAAELALARMDAAQGDYASARTRYEAMLDRKANDVSALMGLYWLSSRAQDKEGAERLLSRALESDPTAAAPQLELIRRDARAGALDRALFEANSLVRVQPQNSRALQILTEIQLKLNDPIAASSAATQLVDVAPSLPQAYVLMARAQVALSNIQDARTTLTRGLKVAPHDPGLTAELVKLDLKRGDTVSALGVAQAFRAREPDATGDRLVGDTYMAGERFEKAIDAYAAGYAKDPSAELALKLKAAYDRDGDPEGGIAALRSWVRDNPDDYGVSLVLASAELEQGQIAASTKTFEALYVEKRNDPVVLNNLAWIYFRHGDSRALEMARKAYAADTNSAEIVDTLGWISLSAANPTDGLDYLRMATAMSPKSPQIRYHMAVALSKTGHRREAKKRLGDLLADSPDFAERADARKLFDSL